MLAIALVGAAGGASIATAEAPEYGTCVKAEKVGKEYKGKFKNSGCTEGVTESERAKKGKYEWYPGAPEGVMTTKGGHGLLETVGHLTVGCASETSVGEFSGTKEVKNVVVTFEGCEAGGVECNTFGSAAGELVTKKLEGIIGWESKAAKKVAFDLYPKGKTGLFIEFSCSGLTFAVQGSVLVPLSPVDKMLKSMTLKYKSKKGVQQVTHFEGGPTDILETSHRGLPYEQSGQTITTVLTNPENKALELNAVI
ncbi:MAG TPA: hypothetical protein VMB51_09210 [Solirubrobacteraceae bacterium]|nr:hypothetical protein [Solirubrobacteraceae bacterium]